MRACLYLAPSVGALGTGNQVRVAATLELPAALLSHELIPEVWTTAREAHIPLPQKRIRQSAEKG